MNKEINAKYLTDAGEYTIVASIADGGEADKRIEVYLGQASDGHHDLIVSDNASMWVVGSEDDADLNRDQWSIIAERCGDIDLSAVRAVDEDLADWLEERRAEAARKADVHEVFEIWIVENGSLAEFGRGWPLRQTATANMCWGDFDNMDDVRARFRELAEENYNRECGPCESADDPEAECAKYVEACAESLNIEWHNDLKWVRCRKMLENGDGERTFVEVL